MTKRISGFLSTPFVIIGGVLFFFGLLIRFGLVFTSDYIEIIKIELEKMKKLYE